MSDYASANGVRVVQGSLFMPRYGVWTCDFALAVSTVLTDPITLTVGNLTARGAVIRAGSYAGSRAYRIVGGAGGWRKNLAAKSYVKDAGVYTDLVMGDLARETGETLSAAPSVSLGRTYVRLAGPASRTLAALAPSWWVDLLGVTQIGTRPAHTINSEFTPTHRIGAAGIVEVATEDPASWTPGARFSNPLLSTATLTVQAARFFWRLDGHARIEVLTT